jgi:N-methylhydantoinase A
MLMRAGGGARDPWEGLNPDAVGAVFAELEVLCRERIEAAGIAPEAAEFVRTADMRYRRQTHDLIIRFGSGPVTQGLIEEAVRRFEETYEALYGKGSGFRQAGVELTTFRVEAIGRTRKPAPSWTQRQGNPRVGSRPIFDPDREEWIATPIWSWLDLPVGERVAGPAVIQHPETTVYIASRQAAVVDGGGNLIIDLTEVRQP